MSISVNYCDFCSFSEVIAISLGIRVYLNGMVVAEVPDVRDAVVEGVNADHVGTASGPFSPNPISVGKLS